MSIARPLPLRTLAIVPLAGVLATCGNGAASQDGREATGGARLGVHVLVGQENDVAPAVARTPPLHTAASGSSLLAVTAGFASNNAAPRDNYRNRWRMLGPPVVYRGYGERFDARAYLALDARGGANHVIQVDKPGVPEGELTLMVVEALHAGRLVDHAVAYPEPALHQSSASVRTDGPALLVAIWLGDDSNLQHMVVPGDGFQVIERFTSLPPHSAVQAVVAARQVDRAGTWQADWYAAPSQGAILWLLAFSEARPSGTQDQAGTAAQR